MSIEIIRIAVLTIIYSFMFWLIVYSRKKALEKEQKRQQIFLDMMFERYKVAEYHRPLTKEQFSKCKCCTAYCNIGKYKEIFVENKAKELLKQAPYGLCPYKECKHKEEINVLVKTKYNEYKRI